jgi:hypothetical protein
MHDWSILDNSVAKHVAHKERCRKRTLDASLQYNTPICEGYKLYRISLVDKSLRCQSNFLNCSERRLKTRAVIVMVRSDLAARSPNESVAPRHPPISRSATPTIIRRNSGRAEVLRQLERKLTTEASNGVLTPALATPTENRWFRPVVSNCTPVEASRS